MATTDKTNKTEMTTTNETNKTEKTMEQLYAEKIAELDKKMVELDEKLAKADAAQQIIASEPKRVKKEPERKVTIQLFKDSERYSEPMQVAINGVLYLVQRGIPVEVPESVARVIEEGYRQDLVSAAERDRLSSEYEAKAAALAVL